jgi:uncharacterized protein (DUF885 family)
VQRDYLPAGRKELAATSLPGGKEYYAQISIITTSLPPDTILQIETEEIKRIRVARFGAARSGCQRPRRVPAVPAHGSPVLATADG